MDNIELTKDEVNAVINTLSEFPYKMSNGLINFFKKKLKEPKKAAEAGQEVKE